MVVTSLSAETILHSNTPKSESKGLDKTVGVVTVLRGQLCGVSITYFDKYGNIIGWDFQSSEQETYVACAQFQASVINNLKSQGYIISYN